MIQTISVYKKVKPDVVLGMGGFVTGPGGIVGWLLRKPLVLHEQNAIAGLTNKILFKFAKKVYAAFPGAFAETKKLTIIGNPVRKEITQLHKPEQRFAKKWAQMGDKQLNILVIGGSLGAAALNKKLPQALAMIAQSQQLQTSYFNKIYVRHQCGDKHLDMTKDNYKWLEQTEGEVNISVEIMPFINDMAKNYTWADLVVCRSGALTVSEIAAVGVASLLVPFPYAVDDHQTANAAYLADEDAAFLIQQSDLSSEKLAELLMSLNQQKLLTMAVNARQLSINNAAEVVADECLLLAG
jgi:UDP-N-acetylglucosamine--N-acetylmuramyl-(pentapeptide) pyrophosphoryl-undecaprenol N-acetylglucosamine transferase